MPGLAEGRSGKRSGGRRKGRYQFGPKDLPEQDGGSWGAGPSHDGAGDPGQAAEERSSRRKPPADPQATARAIVLRQLTMGARTRAQLEQALSRRGIEEDVSTPILDRFEAVDLVDDAEFARQWVESRHAGRGLARRALAYELRQRGVAEDTVKEAVSEVSAADELAAARDLVRRKASSMLRDDPQRRARRLAGMLARKGYGGGVAMQAIREELKDLTEEGFFVDDEDL